MIKALASARKKEILIVLTISLAAFMGALDISIVNISMPTIARHFQVSTGEVSWVILVYLLILSSFLPAFGRLGDIKGFRKIFICGFSVFAVGSFICGVSSNFPELIAARIIQATGAAMLSAIAPSMISIYLPQKIRGQILGYVTTSASLGIAVGPVAGGFITQYLSWRWIFFINVPVGIVGIFLAIAFLPRVEPDSPDKEFDLPGAALLFLSLLSLLYALNMGHETGWTSRQILGAFSAAVICGGLFLLRETRTPDPLIDLKLFRNSSFTLANLSGGMMMAVFTGAIFILPFYLELVINLSIARVGMILLIPSIMMVFSGPVAGHAADRIGSRKICLLATGIMVIAFFLLSFLGEVDAFWFLMLSLALMGVAIGIFIPPVSRLILDNSPPGMEGVSSSVMMTIRSGGAVLGVVIFETVFAGTVGNAASENIHSSINTGLLISGFNHAFLAGAVLAFMAFLLFLWIKNRK